LRYPGGVSLSSSLEYHELLVAAAVGRLGVYSTARRSECVHGLELTHVGTRGIWAARVAAVVLFVVVAGVYATVVAQNVTFALATLGGGAAFLTYTVYLGLLKTADVALGLADDG
jgi:hypothetical protein